MIAPSAVQGAVLRLLERLVEAAPIAWRHDPLFRTTTIAAGVTLAVLLLHLAGPHNPVLEVPVKSYVDPAAEKAWRAALTGKSSPPEEVPKIAPGQPLTGVTVAPVPSNDHFGTFNPGKRP